METGDLHRQENQLSGDLEAMGAVNLTAEEEYQTAKERYDFLNRQYEDMTQRQGALKPCANAAPIWSAFLGSLRQNQQLFCRMLNRLFGGRKKPGCVSAGRKSYTGIEH